MLNFIDSMKKFLPTKEVYIQRRERYFEEVLLIPRKQYRVYALWFCLVSVAIPLVIWIIMNSTSKLIEFICTIILIVLMWVFFSLPVIMGGRCIKERLVVVGIGYALFMISILLSYATEAEIWAFLIFTGIVICVTPGLIVICEFYRRLFRYQMKENYDFKENGRKSE